MHFALLVIFFLTLPDKGGLMEGECTEIKQEPVSPGLVSDTNGSDQCWNDGDYIEVKVEPPSPSTVSDGQDQFFPDPTELRHTNWLKTVCRVCAETATKLIAKTNFKEEFFSLFEIDVVNEDKNIYPENVCAKHAAILYRYRTAKGRGKNFNTCMDMVKFSEHSQDCACLSYGVGVADHTYDTHPQKVRKIEDKHGKVSSFLISLKRQIETSYTRDGQETEDGELAYKEEVIDYGEEMEDGAAMPHSEDSDSSIISGQKGQSSFSSQKHGPRVKGKFTALTETSPEEELIKAQNRKRAALKRRKDAVIRNFESLEAATGYTGFFLFKAPGAKNVIYGGTDIDMINKFKDGAPLLDTETVVKSTRVGAASTCCKPVFQRITT